MGPGSGSPSSYGSCHPSVRRPLSPHRGRACGYLQAGFRLPPARARQSSMRLCTRGRGSGRGASDGMSRGAAREGMAAPGEAARRPGPIPPSRGQRAAAWHRARLFLGDRCRVPRPRLGWIPSWFGCGRQRRAGPGWQTLSDRLLCPATGTKPGVAAGPLGLCLPRQHQRHGASALARCNRRALAGGPCLGCGWQAAPTGKGPRPCRREGDRLLGARRSLRRFRGAAQPAKGCELGGRGRGTTLRSGVPSSSEPGGQRFLVLRRGCRAETFGPSPGLVAQWLPDRVKAEDELEASVWLQGPLPSGSAPPAAPPPAPPPRPFAFPGLPPGTGAAPLGAPWLNGGSWQLRALSEWQRCFPGCFPDGSEPEGREAAAGVAVCQEQPVLARKVALARLRPRTLLRG